MNAAPQAPNTSRDCGSRRAGSPWPLLEGAAGAQIAVAGAVDDVAGRSSQHDREVTSAGRTTAGVSARRARQPVGRGHGVVVEKRQDRSARDPRAPRCCRRRTRGCGRARRSRQRESARARSRPIRRSIRCRRGRSRMAERRLCAEARSGTARASRGRCSSGRSPSRNGVTRSSSVPVDRRGFTAVRCHENCAARAKPGCAQRRGAIGVVDDALDGVGPRRFVVRIEQHRRVPRHFGDGRRAAAITGMPQLIASSSGRPKPS